MEHGLVSENNGDGDGESLAAPKLYVLVVEYGSPTILHDALQGEGPVDMKLRRRRPLLPRLAPAPALSFRPDRHAWDRWGETSERFDEMVNNYLGALRFVHANQAVRPLKRSLAFYNFH
jgi:hypothetical protein